MAAPAPSLRQARLCILFAALLWSTSGAFTKILRENTRFGLNEPAIDPLSIAFWRAFFAAAVLLPLVRRRDLSFRPALWLTGLAFAVMNALFVSAMALGSAANAILLQYTAPMWMYLASIFLLGEPADRRSTLALLFGMAGIGVIITGGWEGGRLTTVLIALGSGVTYAGVLICLRALRGLPPGWLTVWNHLLGALVLVPLIWALPLPTPEQYAVLVLFGGLQMGLAYWLVARGLRVVSPQEAGAITLLEPLLNPLWAYLVWPKTETPPLTTFIGGAFILGALAWRYWPRGNKPVAA